jgi:hypothetical protein
MRIFWSPPYCRLAFVVVLLPSWGNSCAAQTVPSTVTIRQLSEVSQGSTGEFAVNLAPADRTHPVTLRLRCEIGTGKAVFEDDSTEMVLEKSGTVRVHGIVGSDIPGALSLTAWSGADPQLLAATSFFDVFPQTPEPRIFFDGRDVTATRQTVAVGQLIQLTVVLHPGVQIQSEYWSIGNPGDYTGGFLHALFLGGPQPVVREGPATRFYRITPGENRTVSYQLRLTNGTAANAFVTFDVEGPRSPEVQVDSEKVAISQPTPNSSLLGLLGPGISFRAHYSLPGRMLKNFTWVQLIQSDVITLKNSGTTWSCVPKSQPVSSVGSGLDTVFPYDTHNPTLDNPQIHLPSDITEYSRVFRARMYLLWTSGLSNSIAVPLGFVEWTFSGDVALRLANTNEWVLVSSSGGPHDPVSPFTRSHVYPFWNSLVPYTQILACY